jgi:hypothetical protein
VLLLVVVVMPVVLVYALAVPVPLPAPVAVKIVFTLLLAAPIEVNDVLPADVIMYSWPVTKEPAV